MESRALRPWIAALFVAASGCECSDTPDGSLPPGSDCTRAEDCSGDLVCDPGTKKCAEGAACTQSSECGLGALCGSAGECVPNVLGGPCEDNAQCISGERCLGQVCSPPGEAGASCTKASDCRSDLVCDPGNQTCSASAPCTSNASCGAGAICGSSGSCVQNVPGGPCTDRDDCVDGETCVGESCVAGCGGDFYGAESVPPNLLIVIDRSGSMTSEVGGDSKWNIARNATNNLLSSYRDRIFFGLSLFPGFDQRCNDGDRCGPGAINVPIGQGREDEISAFLRDARTCSFGTPIAEELVEIQGYEGLKDPARANFVLLLTDGQATCEDPVPEVTALRNQTPEVKTFVVGFGSEVDPVQLADMAQAGGTARSGSPSYYQADDAASLRSAFGSIAGNVLSCSYTLSGVPPDPNRLYVYFDRVEISRDTSRRDGWDHEVGTNRIEFYGEACSRLQSGSVRELIVIYGCPLPPGFEGDAGVPVTPGTTGSDGGVDPGQERDGGPSSCSSCTQCGTQGCVIPQGQTRGTCGPCTSDFDCCLGSVCASGECIPAL